MIYEGHHKGLYMVIRESFDFPIHIHNNIEVMICIEGTIEVTCNTCTKTLVKGETMVAFPNDFHSYHKTNHGKCMLIIFPMDVSAYITSTIENETFSNFPTNEKCVSVANDLYEWYSQKGNPIILYGYLHVLFGLLLENARERMKKMTDSTFKRAVEYVSLNYTSVITLKSLSKEIGVSQAHLSRIFSEKIDGGFKKYLLILRIEKAKNLLLSTNMNIYDIMQEVGFVDQSTFNRAFKSLTNMTPKEYRTKRQKNDI